jgi:hypothetical protein
MEINFGFFERWLRRLRAWMSATYVPVHTERRQMFVDEEMR